MNQRKTRAWVQNDSILERRRVSLFKLNCQVLSNVSHRTDLNLYNTLDLFLYRFSSVLNSNICDCIKYLILYIDNNKITKFYSWFQKDFLKLFICYYIVIWRYFSFYLIVCLCSLFVCYYIAVNESKWQTWRTKYYTCLWDESHLYQYETYLVSIHVISPCHAFWRGPY